METLSNWAGVVQWLLAGFCGWVWWSLKRRFTPKEDHSALRGDHSQLERRVGSIESAVKNLPTMKDITDLIVKQTEMAGDIKRIDDGSVRMQRQLDRIEEFLRGNK